MSVITRGAHPKALYPGVRKFVMGQYAELPRQYAEIFEVKSSNMAYEEDVEITGFGLAQVKSENAAIAYDSHQQGFIKRYMHVGYALGYIVTHEEIEDNLYKSRSFQRGRQLAMSFRTTKEIVAANVLNRAFNAAYTGGDGQRLIVGTHPTLAGNQSNALAVPADLSEAALEDVLIQIMEARNSRGHPIRLTGQKLIIPPALGPTASRILKSTLQNDTANNAVNAIRVMGLLPRGMTINHYLTDPDAWFVQTDAPDGLMLFDRKPFTFAQDNDFDTMNARFRGYMRFSVGWTDWRGVYGSDGA